uniref:Uncharacterized protein n=1 Tax=Rhizophora mucronata TaxID=61149 RepID=A0A2P2MVN5_RHIMU
MPSALIILQRALLHPRKKENKNISMCELSKRKRHPRKAKVGEHKINKIVKKKLNILILSCINIILSN